MCTAGRFINNPYDGHQYYVECGKCDACLEKKALRRFGRLQDEGMNGRPAFFVTLTYTNDYIPYIKKSELNEFISAQPAFQEQMHFAENTLNVYRGDDVMKKLRYSDFAASGKIPDLREYSRRGLKTLRKLVDGKYIHLKDKVGVCILDDFQKFFKRLKINLFRSGYSGYFSYFYCNEYGTKHSRPHLHALIYFTQGYDEVIRRAIIKSWSYADLSRDFYDSVSREWRSPIELAKNPEKYVSEYINSRTDVSEILWASKPFKLRYKFSYGFAMDFKEFSLDKVLDKVSRADLSYPRTEIKNGVPTISKVRIPKYVLSTYWPKFKGYRYLSDDALVQLYENPARIFTKERSVRLSFDIEKQLYNVKNIDGFSDSNYMGLDPTIYKLFNILTNEERESIYRKFQRLRSKIPHDLVHDWAFFYPRVWSLFSSDCIKHSYDNCVFPTDLFEHWFNISDYVRDGVSNLFLDDVLASLKWKKDDLEIEPQNFIWYKFENKALQKSFNDAIKHHIIKNEFYEK